MFVIAVPAPSAHRNAYYIGAAAHDILRRAWSDGDTHMSNAQFYATREAAEADYALLSGKVRAKFAIRPATPREQVVARFTARAVAYQSARDWNAAGEGRLSRIGKRVRARAVAG